MRKNHMKMAHNDYKKHLGMTLDGIGNLLGLSREAVRQKIERYTRWRTLARYRLAQLGEVRAELARLQRQMATGNFKEMPTKEMPTKHPCECPTIKVAPPTVKEMAWREIMFSSVRAMHACERLNITSLDSLLDFGLDRFSIQYAVGKKTMQDIWQILINHKIVTIDKPLDFRYNKYTYAKLEQRKDGTGGGLDT